VAAQLGQGLDAELALHVLLVVEQHAAGGLTVAAGTAGLLDIVLQRARRLGMDDNAHVLLVHAHAEGIGRADDLQLAGDEGLLDAPLLRGADPGVEVLDCPALALESLGQRLDPLARGRVDDGGPCVRRRLRLRAVGPGIEVLQQDRMDASVLLMATGELDLEAQVVALDAALIQRQAEPQLVAEIGQDLGGHVLFGGRGEAGHRRHRRLLALRQGADEAPGVEVVRAEVVAPLGQAVGLVEDPTADLAAGEHRGDAAVAQLLRRDVQHGHVAETHPLHDIAALRRRQHAVDGRRGGRAGLLRQVVHLVLHQRLQRRDDHGQRPAAHVPDQRRELEAQGLAATGGQQCQQRLLADAVADDGPLQAVAIGRRRLRPERVEAEPALQLHIRVVGGAAPRTVGIGAGRIAQGLEQGGGGRKAVPDPAGQHRVAAGHLQPGRGIGQHRPQARGGQVIEDQPRCGAAAGALLPVLQQRLSDAGQVRQRTGHELQHIGNAVAAGGVGLQQRGPAEAELEHAEQVARAG